MARSSARSAAISTASAPELDCENRGDPHARGGRDGLLGGGDLTVGYDPRQVLGDPLARLQARAGQQHREFVAAQARDQVGAAQAQAQLARDGLQQLIAGPVAVGVVDALEVVQVDYDE